MNLIITDQCNRSCPYCFAREKVVLPEDHESSASNHQYISLENVNTYLDFIERSHDRQFKILGGEPTLHPQLPQIVELGLTRGFSLTIFTNGLWSRRIRDYFSDPATDAVKFVVNVNEPHLQTQAENRSQRESLRIAAHRASLGFNIYRPDFDFLFAAELIHEYKLKREIRLGLASPVVRTKNEHLSTGQLKSCARSIARQLRVLEQQDILGMLDCGFTLCMFDEEDLGSLTLTTRHGFASICSPVIDVGPNLSAWHCFPLSEIINININDFSCREEIDRYYTDKFATLRNLGIKDECVGCKYLRRGQCSGGCLGRVIREVEASGDSRLMEKLC